MYPLGLASNQMVNIFDASFKSNSVGKKYNQLACQVEIVDTILIYLANWFSKGIPYEETRGGKRLEDTDLIKLINNPNPFQGRQEFLAEWYYYLLASGTSYIYPKNGAVGFEGTTKGTQLLNLNFDNVEEPLNGISIFDFDGDINLKYVEELRNGEAVTTPFNFNEIMPFFDSTNGIGNSFYKGKSRMESIRDEIKNIFLATKAKQNKLDLSGITLVTPDRKAGNNDMSKGLDKVLRVNKDGSNTTHKDHIESQFKNSGLSKGRSIIVSSEDLKSMNLTEGLEKVMFDPLRIEDARTIKRKYMIPENILPLTDRSEKERNQESEVLQLIQTMIEPYADNLGDTLSQWFGIDNKLKFDYTHTPAYSVVQKEKSESDFKTSTMINELVKTQVLKPTEAKKMLEEKGIL